MDFTVLGRTPEGCSSLSACHVEGTEKQRQEKTRADRNQREKGYRKENWDGDMIRLSLVINLSEAVRTF